METDSYRALLVDAFTADPLSGTAAGVVPDAADLSTSRMEALARELTAGETAFVLPSDAADRRIRYFTPSGEVDRCDHATIAAHAHLLDADAVGEGDHTLETNDGTRAVTADDGVVWTRRDVDRVDRVDVDYGRVGDALGVDPAALRDVGADLPTAVVSTGRALLVVPVNFLERLGGASPDAAALRELVAEHDAAGVCAVTFDALDADSTLHVRCFVPDAGAAAPTSGRTLRDRTVSAAEEEPPTGTASGACGAYLARVDAFDSTPDEMRFEQGHYVDRPGHVRVRVDGETVRLGGRATVSLDGTVAVPVEEDDGIVEA